VTAASEILAELRVRGVRIEPRPNGGVKLVPIRLIDPNLLSRIRAHKAELLAQLAHTADRGLTKAVTVVEQSLPGSRLVEVRAPGYELAPASNVNTRPSWPRSITPNSRHPLIPPEVRAKIESVEADARAKGWPAELLWNAEFWDSPRGLAALLNADDEIVEVTTDWISILKTRHEPLRFMRRIA
jgi:hypothetical protein